jgi:hypothetical protein
MQYCSSESTIELSWSITFVWYTQDACRAARAFHQMETLRVRMLLGWSDIGRMQHEIRCSRARRSGQGMPAQIWPIYGEKGIGKLSLGILALASSTLLKTRSMLIACGYHP